MDSRKMSIQEGFEKVIEAVQELGKQVETVQEEQKRMKREMEDLQNQIDSVKINYLVFLFAIAVFLLLDRYGPVSIGPVSIDKVYGTIFVIVVLNILFYAENVRFAKYMMRKMVFKRGKR